MSNPDLSRPYWRSPAGAGLSAGDRRPQDGRGDPPAARRGAPRRAQPGSPEAQELRDRLGLRAQAVPRQPGTGPARTAQRAGSRAPRDAERGVASYDRYGDVVANGRTLQRERRDYAPGVRPGERPPGGRTGSRRAGSRGPGHGGGGGNGHHGGSGRRPGDGRRPGLKNWLLYGAWWRHWTWKKAIMVLLGAVAMVLLLALLGVFYVYSATPIPSEVSEAALEQSSNVYFSNGKTLIGTFSTGTDRQMLTSAQIPAVVKQAVIAAEDRHFYTEGGISPTGILRAAYEDVSGGTFQGGSTITQQFVRNYYAGIGTEQTASRKIKEIFVAVKLAHEKSKDWILTQYLNTVYLGADAYGVGAAAQAYFSKPAASLSISQAAMIAAMINQPGYFNPDPRAGAPYQALVSRWQYVLTNMARDGAISQQQASAQKFPVIVPGPLDNGWTGYRGYIMQAVQSELNDLYHFTNPQIDSRGLKIVTTFSQPLMAGLYRAVDENKAQLAADGTPLPYWAHVGALLEQPGTGAILAMYGGPSYSAADCAQIKCQLNMATQARNQVGSSFKPYVLATAVKQGMDVQDSVLDGYQSICSPSDAYPMMPSVTVGGTTCPDTPFGWYNFNSFGESNGPVSVADASALSLNTAYGDLIHRAGTQNVINMAKQFGVSTASYPAGSDLQAMVGQSGIALGQASLTVEEQATTFATLAADGEYATPHVIARLSEAGAPIPLRVVHREVLTPAQAADVDYALSFDTIYGTAADNGQLSPFRPTIGKTGTTNVAQDAFFIGAIPQYSLAVGMFTKNQDQQLGGQTLNGLAEINGQQGGYGGAWPTTIWRTFMQDEFASLPVQQLPTPDYTGFAKWVQVQVQAQPSAPQHKHGQSCHRGQCSNGTTPSPPVSVHHPRPTCTPFPGHQCGPSPPGPGAQPAATETAVLTQAAEEAARARAAG